tara:strand:+ start:2394 stop:2507 length:114 start_codon:yes stop_codon:yes gene_type:complete
MADILKVIDYVDEDGRMRKKVVKFDDESDVILPRPEE